MDGAPKNCEYRQGTETMSVAKFRECVACTGLRGVCQKSRENVVAAIGTIRNRARKIANFQLLLAKFYLLLELFVGIIARLAI